MTNGGRPPTASRHDRSGTRTPTRPDPPAATESHPHLEGARGAGAAQLLLTRGADTRRESRHVAIGLGILVMVSVVLLNFWIYQNAQNRIVQGRWDYLTRHADASREQIRALFATSERQLRFVAEGERLNGWVRAAMTARSDPSISSRCSSSSTARHAASGSTTCWC
jgi:hypothetical protein